MTKKKLNLAGLVALSALAGLVTFSGCSKEEKKYNSVINPSEYSTVMTQKGSAYENLRRAERLNSEIEDNDFGGFGISYRGEIGMKVAPGLVFELEDLVFEPEEE